MNTSLFAERMVALLPQMIRGFARRESNDLSRGKISIPQMAVLEILCREREIPMNRLAKALGVTRPAATGLVDRLIAQGLASRRGDPTDRRVIRVSVTPKGRRVFSNIWEQKRRMIAEVFGRLPAADRAHYLATLERVVGILSEEPR